MATLAEQQLDLLRRMAALAPAPCIMGGYAEDALLAGTVTRPHVDVDWILPRRELDLRLEQARQLGFAELETWGEAAPGEPFYLFAQQGELKLELGIVDELDGAVMLRVHRLFFEIDGREPPGGYRVHLPNDLFDQPVVELDGIPIRAASPRALYQLRAGIARHGSFGPLSDRQLEAMARLRERFFPTQTAEELEPRVEPLPAF